MADELDLYGRSRWGWKGIAIGVATVLLAGIGGYRWITTLTPVDREEAVRLFQQEVRERSAGRGDPDAAAARTSSRRKDTKARSQARAQKRQASSGRLRQASSGEGARERAPAGRRRASTSTDNPLPEEGVYSWDTRGYERVGGARRSFPRESQRIVTRDGGAGWRQHHYFSKEREIWTHFRVSKRGAAISYQRNKIVFGPVSSDSEIEFSPPMLVGPSALRVGQTWDGRWSGDTHGSYRGRTFERRHMSIGGTKVEVFGIHVHMCMDGEIRGEVDARVWLAPEYGMTVRERFVQDVRTNMGSYYAEWTMTAKSLRPRQ